MLSKLKAILKSKGFLLFTRPYELNIVGLRAKDTKPNTFQDEIHVFYKETATKWNYHVYKATTDPGTFWLKNPAAPQGTAILMEGQYKNCYGLGIHHGEYLALVQVRPITVYRDYDRTEMIQLKDATKQTGMFGINIHHAKSKGTTKYIDNYSAGCQVFANAEDFAEFIQLCQKHKSLYGNEFTYTLIDFRAVRRVTIRRIAMAASFITAIIVGIVFKEKSTYERSATSI